MPRMLAQESVDIALQSSQRLNAMSRDFTVTPKVQSVHRKAELLVSDAPFFGEPAHSPLPLGRPAFVGSTVKDDKRGLLPFCNKEGQERWHHGVDLTTLNRPSKGPSSESRVFKIHVVDVASCNPLAILQKAPVYAAGGNGAGVTGIDRMLRRRALHAFVVVGDQGKRPLRINECSEPASVNVCHDTPLYHNRRCAYAPYIDDMPEFCRPTILFGKDHEL